jgi:rSAM/selenodomain-associated transferase 1
MSVMTRSDQLLVFTRYPHPGKTKTRLIPALGEQKAAKLQKYLTEQTLVQVSALQLQFSLAVAIYFTGCDRLLMEQWLGLDREYCLQCEGDLGDRMQQAFKESFAKKKLNVVIIGIDCLDLTAEILRSAFAALEHFDAVLGPAEDGGYYLLGMRRLIPEVFAGIPWSSDRVFALTYQRLQDLGLSCRLLPILSDCDRPEDLVRLSRTNPEFYSKILINQDNY